MKSLSIILFAFFLLVLQSTLAHILPWDMFVPNAALTIVLYMGLHDYSSGQGAIVAFCVGYLMDAFAGSPMGLFTFVSVAVFLISKVAALRLFLQGWLFEIILTFFLVMVAGGLVLVIRALFDQDFGSLLIHAKVVTLRAAATAVCAPFVFRALSWFDQVSSKGTADARKVFRS